MRKKKVKKNSTRAPARRRKIVLNVEVSKRRAKKGKKKAARSSTRAHKPVARRVIMIACAVFVTLYFACTCLPPMIFKVRWVRVENEYTLSGEEIALRAGIREGANLLALDLAELRRRIISHPDIREVEIRRVIPGGVEIEVGERYPVASIFSSRRYVVDEEGIILSARKERQNLTLPTITGLTEEIPGEGKMLRSEPARRALQIITRCRDSNLCSQMDLISVDVNDSGNLIMRTRTIAEIRLGNNEFNYRLDLLSRILEQRRARGFAGPAKYIDLRWNSATEMPLRG